MSAPSFPYYNYRRENVRWFLMVGDQYLSLKYWANRLDRTLERTRNWNHNIYCKMLWNESWFRSINWCDWVTQAEENCAEWGRLEISRLRRVSVVSTGEWRGVEWRVSCYQAGSALPVSVKCMRGPQMLSRRPAALLIVDRPAPACP